MRGDLLHDNKGIHIKLKKDIHVSFRAEMFKAGISMQEAFNEFALQVTEGTKSGQNIINTAASKKIKQSIEKGSKRREPKYGDVDIDTLYELINAKISDIS
jgi:hypothetical protein